jgi:putative DNA methylase
MITAGNSLLDQGRIPVQRLAVLSAREGWRPKQQYQVHRWFARRFSSVVRSLLVAACASNDTDFWAGYKDGVDYTGFTVLDPFVGGGTSVVEAQKLGATTIGVDVDAVACAITRFETQSHDGADLEAALHRLEARIGDKLLRYYTTRDAEGQQRKVLHFFWVQRVKCGECGQLVDAHPHYQLAYQAEGYYQWVFCPDCHAIAKLPRSRRRHVCGCGRKFQIHSGIVRRGVLMCPRCNHHESLINLARRTKSCPKWYLFALETLPLDHRRRAPLSDRLFQTATDTDRAIFRSAERALKAHQRKPDSRICPPGRYRERADLIIVSSITDIACTRSSSTRDSYYTCRCWPRPFGRNRKMCAMG